MEVPIPGEVIERALKLKNEDKELNDFLVELIVLGVDEFRRKPILKKDVKECLDYLHLVTGRKFRKSNELNARLRDYTVSDIKAVIDYQSKKWMGSSMQQYLRPQTLFNPIKFEGYLNDSNQQIRKTESRSIAESVENKADARLAEIEREIIN